MERSWAGPIANASATIGSFTRLGSVPLVCDQRATCPAHEWRSDEISHYRTVRMLSRGYQAI